jgi:hypothetical protein
MLNVRTVNIESEDKGSDGTGDDIYCLLKNPYETAFIEGLKFVCFFEPTFTSAESHNTVARLYLNNGGDRSDATNNSLLKEIILNVADTENAAWPRGNSSWELSQSGNIAWQDVLYVHLGFHIDKNYHLYIGISDIKVDFFWNVSLLYEEMEQ